MPLSCGNGFKGTRHCEACLAAHASGCLTKDVLFEFAVSCLLLRPTKSSDSLYIEKQSHRCIKTVLPSVCVSTQALENIRWAPLYFHGQTQYHHSMLTA